MTGASCYRFATEAQKRTCLATGLAATLLLDPAGGEAVPGFADGVRRLAAAPNGDLFAIDGQNRLATEAAVGPEVGMARRLVVDARGVWVLTHADLHRFDRSLQPLLRLDAAGTTDIAAAPGGGLWRLGDGRIERFDADGRRTGEVFETTGPVKAIAAVGDTLFLQSLDAGRLELLETGSGRTAGINLNYLLASGDGGAGEPELVQGGDRLLVRRQRKDGGFDHVVLDSEGSVVARGRSEEGEAVAATALAGDDLVAVFADRGTMRRFAGGAVAGGVRWLTPAMETGSHSEGWIRAEVGARLPEGATLSLRWAALPEEALRHSVEAVRTEPSRPVADRLARTVDLLRPYWSAEFTYTGRATADGLPAEQSFDFPLEKEAGTFLWIDLKLRRNDATEPPVLHALTVHHGAERLIDHLPAIFRGTGDADGTLKRLLGVLEATTHGIDRRIEALAARLDPQRTEQRWLGALAATLGLPFDDALTPDMQRRLVAAAAALLAGRGTRGGLAALFEALFPGRRVRILDRSIQFIPVALGGPGFEGSRLPALLTGPSPRMPRLNARLVLGETSLSRAEGDGRLAPMPEVLVSIPATGAERRRFESAVRQMAEAMIPAGVRLRLRWTPWRGRQGRIPSDWLTVVDDPAPLRIGDDPLGRATLTGRRDPRVDDASFGSAGHRLL